MQRYEKIAPISAQTLEYAVLIEQGLGNKENAKGYREMLARLYPDYQPANLMDAETSGVEKPVLNRELAKKPMSDRIHVVQAGENLYRISLKYNVRMQRLIEWNNLQDGSQVRVGTKIYVSDPNAN